MTREEAEQIKRQALGLLRLANLSLGLPKDDGVTVGPSYSPTSVELSNHIQKSFPKKP